MLTISICMSCVGSAQKQCWKNPLTCFLNLGENVRSFDDAAPYFDLTEAETEEVHRDCHGERSRKMKMLWNWRRKKGSDATNLAIVRIFLHMKDRSLAELVLKESLSTNALSNAKGLTDYRDQENTSEKQIDDFWVIL